MGGFPVGSRPSLAAVRISHCLFDGSISRRGQPQCPHGEKGSPLRNPVRYFFLLCVLVQLFKLTDVLFHGTARTRALEPLALAGAAFALAGTLPEDRPNSSSPNSLARALIITGPDIFAFCMIIFGLQHFMYADFIATLIPAWMPARLFLAYFTGCALIVAGVAIVVKKQARIASALLGFMFLLWVILLNAPRVAAALHNGDESTSLFVALAMARGSFIVASVISRR
jgi:uncharacterized membrane protein